MPRCCSLSADIPRPTRTSLVRVLPDSQSIPSRSQQLLLLYFVRPHIARCTCRLPLQSRSWVSMIGFAKSDHVGVLRVIVVILDEDTFILETYNGNPVAVVFGEGGDGQAERRSSSERLGARCCFAPIYAIDRPCSQFNLGRYLCAK